MGADHFYTVDPDEANRAMASHGYHWERVACYVFSPRPGDPRPPGTGPLYRLYNDDIVDHFYTMDAAERDRAIASHGYRDEGIACYLFGSPVAGTVPLFRMYNNDEGDHFYTTDAAERTRADGYVDEGIAGYVYPSDVPGAKALLRLFRPGGSWLDDIGDFFSTIGDAVWGVVSTVGGAIGDTLDGLLGWAFDAFGWLLEQTLFNIPWLGGFLRDLWNIALTGVWGLNPLSLLDGLLGLLGIRPEKRMRIMMIIQRDVEGQPVATSETIFPLLQLAIDTFKGQANVRLIPVGPFIYTSPFQDVPSASSDYLYTEPNASDTDTLDVSCDSDLLVDDLGTVGTKFNTKLTNDFFFAGWRRILGYGAPVVAFAVRSFKNGHSAGCSLGPLADYVVVSFLVAAPRTLAHEFGHACNLAHTSDPDDLMTPGESGGMGLTLPWYQVVMLRASRHCTYF